MKLVDRNVREVTDEEWNWAELVIISGMIVQKDDMAVQISEAKHKGLPVAVGGPFASSTPDAPELDLADFKILDEGEITLPMFLDALERGQTSGRFTVNGIRVIAGFIIGFDGENDGAGHRIVDFVTRTGIPAAMMGMLQALPKTALWARLEREGRLIQGEDAAKGVNQTNLLNFKPTRPIRDIANEYVDAFCALYAPNAYLDRVYSYYLKMGAPRWKAAAKLTSLVDLKALSIVVWRQGIKHSTRTRFWRYLFGM